MKLLILGLLSLLQVESISAVPNPSMATNASLTSTSLRSGVMPPRPHGFRTEIQRIEDSSFLPPLHPWNLYLLVAELMSQSELATLSWNEPIRFKTFGVDEAGIWVTIKAFNIRVLGQPVLTYGHVLMGLIDGLVYMKHDHGRYFGFYETHIEVFQSETGLGDIWITRNRRPGSNMGIGFSNFTPPESVKSSLQIEGLKDLNLPNESPKATGRWTDSGHTGHTDITIDWKKYGQYARTPVDFIFTCIFEALMIITYETDPHQGPGAPFHELRAKSAGKSGPLWLVLDLDSADIGSIQTIRGARQFLWVLSQFFFATEYTDWNKLEFAMEGPVRGEPRMQGLFSYSREPGPLDLPAIA